MIKFISLVTIFALLCNPTMGGPLRPREISKALFEAKKNGAKPEELKKLKAELMDKLNTARAGGISFKAVKEATDKGANLDDIKAKINENNLQRYKRKGLFKKKPTSLSSILFPGVAPNDYQIGLPIDMVVDTVDSMRTGLPIQYYDLPTCDRPQAKLQGRKRKNIGERLAGKTLSQLAPFKVEVLKNVGCSLVCQDPVWFRQRDISKVKRLIEKQYKVNVSIDGLPVQVKKSSSGTVARGYPLGARLIDEAVDVTEYVYHNHVRFNILYNADESYPGHVRIVGFNAVPVSIDHKKDSLSETCSPDKPVSNQRSTLLHLNFKRDGGKERPVYYSYEVIWSKSNIQWTDRWDIYMLGRVDDTSAHHMSVINSIMAVLFLGSVVAVILVRSLRRDLSVYNDMDVDLEEDGKEETGWKLVHGDVFRPPSSSPMALSVMVGTGCQLAASAIITLIMSQTHLINPMMKGRALSSIITTFIGSGTVAGYVSSRIFKFCGGKNWKVNTFYTAAAFPGIMLSLFLSLNLFLTFWGSAKSVRVFTIFVAFFLWLCIASPLVFLGSFIGFKSDLIALPTRTNQIARVVPSSNSILSSPYLSLIVGAMPFSTICIELYFLMGAIWLHEYYFLMGYLLVITLLVGVTCSLLSIVMCYVRLCSEDHRWWWKSFTDSASCGLWLFLYSIWFLTCRMNLQGLMPVIVYFTYMTMVSIAVALYCGAVAFLCTLWFTRKIYSTVKLD